MGNNQTPAEFNRTSINPNESLGYPIGNKLLQELAEKASKTFPPKFTAKSQTGNVESVEGNRAVVTGRNLKKGNRYPTAEMIQQVKQLYAYTAKTKESNVPYYRLGTWRI